MTAKLTLSRFTTAGFLCVFIVGLIVILGWFTNNTLLVQIHPSFVPMQFNTALGFVLLGGAGISLLGVNSPYKKMTLGLAASCFVLCFLTLLQYLFALDFKIDELFMAHAITTKTYHPGRMAPNTAVCFVLAASCFLILQAEGLKKVLQYQLLNILSYFGFVLSLIALSGYVMGLETTYGWGHYTRMALHTSVSFVLFFSAFILYVFILSRLKKNKNNHYANIVVALCAVCSISIWQYLNQKENADIQARIDLISQNVSSSIDIELNSIDRAFTRLSIRWMQQNGTPKVLWQADASQYIQDNSAYQFITWVDASHIPQWQSLNPSLKGNSVDVVLTALTEMQILNQIKLAKQCQMVIVDKDNVRHNAFVYVCPLWLNNQTFDGFMLGSVSIDTALTIILDRYNYHLVSTALAFKNKPLFSNAIATEVSTLKLSKKQPITLKNQTLMVNVQATNRLFESFNNALDEVVLFFCLVLSVLLGFTLQYWSVAKFSLFKLNKSKAALSHSLVMQKAIVDNLGEALIIIDQKGLVNRFTAAAESIFGYKMDEVVGQSVTLLMPERFQAAHDKKLAVSDIQEPSLQYGQAAQLFAKHKRGHEFPIELVITKINGSNKTYFIGLIKDISEHVETQTQLITAKHNAELASEAKSHFLSNMSHEIRTPLNSIFGTLQILEKSADDNTDKPLIQKSLYSARSLLTIINDILDVSKIEANQLKIENCNFAMSQLVDSIKSELAEVANKKGIEFKVELDLQGHDYWQGDPVRIRQIILNFASNAVKFTEKGLVTIKAATVLNSHSGLNNKLEFYCEVSDTGIGMTEEYCQRLFNRFQQADESITRRFGGTGLGMAISKSLIDLMGGRVDILSEVNAGSTFKIWLPLALGKEEAQTELLKVDDLDLSNVTILLAEDNEINQIVFQAMLQKTQATIHVANNGQVAVEMVNQVKPDLIFMDIQMPVMGGIEATDIIKQSHRHIPVIALTANAMAEHQRLYAEKGFDDFVAKPIEMDVLNRVINKMLLRHR
ncbi:ATP-binding protein [Algibacillus agarilyticus]|uniref:ATP-binding protein n=1 Tax=Algibacillus agarilyticus TaxID=2234133 RepID=UPI000DD0A5F3|nr:ATP-binding protein [Algibacillus agarilyticus]